MKFFPLILKIFKMLFYFNLNLVFFFYCTSSINNYDIELYVKYQKVKVVNPDKLKKNEMCFNVKSKSVK
jgi:hypothetical protein